MECPYCGHDNIRGADLCANCGADLAGLDLPAEQAEGQRRHFHDIKLQDLDPNEPLEVRPETSVAEAVRLMREQVHGAVFVVEDDHVLLGILTERDLLRQFALGDLSLEDTTVGEVMTPHPDTLPISSPLSMAVNMMGSHGYRHVPIVDEKGRLIGFSSVRGMMNYLRTHVLQ